MAWLSACLLLLTPQDASSVERRWEDIHPALRVTRTDLEKIWERGVREAKSKPNHWVYAKPIVRSLEEVRDRGMVSWICISNQEFAIYRTAFSARQKYLPDEEMAELRQKALDQPFESSRLSFEGELSAYPKFKGPGGSVSERAIKLELGFVRAVLKVGDRIYQPIAQPTGLRPRTDTASNRYSIEHDRDTVYYTENYEFYTAPVKVDFDLFDKDGTARIRKSDRDFAVIFIYGDRERRATFRLSDLAGLRR